METAVSLGTCSPAPSAHGVFILPRAWTLGRQALRILTQVAPQGLNLNEVRSDLLNIGGVIDVHDLDAWTLTSEMDVATVHLMTTRNTDPHPVLDRARDLLQTKHNITHATLQVEPEDHQGCSEVTW